MKDKHIVAVAEAIRYHLYRWPDASGTSAEIGKTWLPAAGVVEPETILAALAQLEAQGFIERHLFNNEFVWQLRRGGSDRSPA